MLPSGVVVGPDLVTYDDVLGVGATDSFTYTDYGESEVIQVCRG